MCTWLHGLALDCVCSISNALQLPVLCRRLYPDNKVHGANTGPIWGRQDPCGPHDGPMNFGIWVLLLLSGPVAGPLADGDTAFKWRLWCCCWLIVVRRRLTAFSKPLNLYFELSDRFEIWQVPPQHCCLCPKKCIWLFALQVIVWWAWFDHRFGV